MLTKSDDAIIIHFHLWLSSRDVGIPSGTKNQEGPSHKLRRVHGRHKIHQGGPSGHNRVVLKKHQKLVPQRFL